MKVKDIKTNGGNVLIEFTSKELQEVVNALRHAVESGEYRYDIVAGFVYLADGLSKADYSSPEKFNPKEALDAGKE